MRRITEEALSSQRDLAIRTIKWLMCSFRPLTGDELVSAVTLVLDQPSELDITLDMVLDSCKHLIVQDEDGIVKFAHLSVEEYLQSFLLNGRQEFSLQESHAQASISCLLYLSVRSRKPEERPKKYSFHAYALMYWAAHCTECSEVRTDNVRPLGHMLRRLLVEDLGPFEEWSRAFEAESKETTATFEMDVILDMWDDTLAFESSKDLIRPHPFLICCVFDLSEVLDILELGPEPKLSTDRTEADVKARGVFLAVKYRRKDTLMLLLEIKDINTEGNDTASGKTALHESVQAERLDFVELLVMRGANINAEDMKGNTPLHYAALATDPGIALILLNSGANVNARNQEGIMPLNTAIKDGWQDVIEALIENGANPNARSQDHDGSGGTHEPLFNDELDNPALFDGDTVTIPMNTEYA
jgi:Ankyrin repeats (3 copies)